ncbi:HPF/RaiA family ribosome-associated protein [Pseudomonas indica]|uniref:Ribosomal subunit interface protein n=1 Tax=Pseudomonas indica TaxID=137658 RepID=A0A1G8VD54_9PSED|nr:HPF/RaiA family ribosome-associated protein [Pseudomonas indica]MBU3057741.1 HPF/RaiA family ribosome-associated protein [Pseudomonas indica]PAU57908.1 ribosomal subunit interface protein [Pseudomonas indica]SDJ63070.1 ribosomal subunit interface protein [Pseudomonas indica]
MQVLVNSDNHIDGSAEFADRVQAHLANKLKRFDDHLTRIEVHFNDENSQKGGATDKRCQIEAHIKGRDTVSVTHHAESLNLALDGATEKLGSALARVVDKSRNL